MQEKSILPVIRNDFEFTRKKKMKKNKEKKIAIDYNEIQYYRMYNGT